MAATEIGRETACALPGEGLRVFAGVLTYLSDRWAGALLARAP